MRPAPTSAQAAIRQRLGGKHATYRLDADSGLHVSITATNKGSRPARGVTATILSPNVFVSGEKLIVLEPRESVTVRWGIRNFL